MHVSAWKFLNVAVPRMRNLGTYDSKEKMPQLSPILPFQCNLAAKK